MGRPRFQKEWDVYHQALQGLWKAQSRAMGFTTSELVDPLQENKLKPQMYYDQMFKAHNNLQEKRKEVEQALTELRSCLKS